jgi:4-hydroxybenzoate polyprenyltransferase
MAPLVFSGAFEAFEAIYLSLLATFYFCIAASSVYILNDLKDIESDKLHPVKSKTRPLASCEIPKINAIVLLLVCYCIVGTASLISLSLFYIIVSYIVLNILYTYKFKQVPILDIFIIGIGFVLRIYAGAVVIDVPISPWMFVTTFSLALYLASVKRRQELLLTDSESRSVLSKYNAALVERYAEMSATGALVFYSLFVLSQNPDLVFTIPFVIYGLFRYWYVSDMLKGGESPTDSLFTDFQLAFTCVAWITVSVFILNYS